MIDCNIRLCVGCRMCEVACSLFHSGSVSPALSRIRVAKLEDIGLDMPVACVSCAERPCLDCPKEALSAGPSDTRGGVRGLCVRRFPDQIKSMQWERIQFSSGLMPKTLEMGDLFDPEDVKACAAVLETATSPADAMTAWYRRKDARS